MTDTTKDRLEIIKTICIVVGAVGVVLAAVGLLLQRQVWITYHERARVEKGVALLSEFTKALGPSTRSVQKLIETASADTLDAIYTGKSFEVGEDQKTLIEAALTDLPKLEFKPKEKSVVQTASATYVITEAQSFFLRWKVVSYLNALEVICQAWLRDVADRKMLATELAGLYAPVKGQSFCSKYREKFDGDMHYPALTAFVATLQKPLPKPTTVGP